MPNSSGDCYLQTSPSSPCGSVVSPSDVFHNGLLDIKHIPTTTKKSLRKRKSTTRSTTTTKNSSSMVSRSFSMCSEDSNPFSATGTGTETGSDSEDGDDSLASLYSMFSSMEKVTIESLKAKLSSLPEGQTDLGALLVAAKVDLTVEDIVGPPLTQVKKIMEAKGLSEWQMTLCLKIRRRKKNTVRFNDITELALIQPALQ